MRTPYIYTLLVASTVLLAVGCGAEEKGTLEEKKAELTELESKADELKAQMKQLKEEIAELDTTDKGPQGRYVTSIDITAKPFAHFIELQGTATSDDNVSVTTEMGGNVLKILVNEGQQVRKGQELILLDDDVIRKQINEINVALDLAKTTYEKQKKLWDQNIGSEIQYLQAKNQKDNLESKLASAYAQLEKTRVKSPINGTIDAISINEGELASPGYPLVRVVDLEKIEVHADASEAYITSVVKGDSVMVRFPVLDKTYNATIAHAGQVIDPTNRTFKVEINLPNKTKELKANLLAVIEVKDYEVDSTIVVPTKYIQQLGGKDVVYVVSGGEDGQKVALRTEVRSGMTYAGNTEVLSGLKPGDEIVAEGARDLVNGEAIIVKN